ncbi:MAG: threonine/serine exporter family protein [Clostridiales Family XIII bacterium]|jgi:uncharacterized membrane protein YjjP (DUF1212 family)|nr:threonine/serine exporter family protein [Clostridiales Family XIII bacterium]
MIENFQKKVLVLALFAGELMMKSGAEIYRVEDTITRICKACRIDYVECFATTTGIFLSLDMGGDDEMRTFIKRIDGSAIDLERISLINKFSREFTTTDMSIDAGMNQLRAISSLPIFSLPLRILGAVLVGAFMCPIYGGGFVDMCVAAGASCVGYMISFGVGRFRLAGFIRVFISCLGCTLTALAAAGLYPWHNTTAIILGAVTIFMPGVAITNAARDLLSGDMLSGVARATDAAITSVAIAGGAGMVTEIWLMQGRQIGTSANVFPLPIFFLFGVLLTIGFCLQLNAPKNQMVLACAIGGVGMLALKCGPVIGFAPMLTVFAGTGIVAILGEIASRAGRDATTVFIIPGIIPFVPGLGLFESMSAILANDIDAGISRGASTLLTAGGIAISLIVVATGARLTLALIGRIKRAMSKPDEE